jgi:CRISPR-associated endoribonuclease Cas6
MFRSWLERWNHFAPVYLGSGELLDYLATAVAVSRHKIQTRRVTVHSGKITGFTGEVSLHILPHADPLLTQVATLLIHYSQFAGTGIKTRLGIGQTHLTGHCTRRSSLSHSQFVSASAGTDDCVRWPVSGQLFHRHPFS